MIKSNLRQRWPKPLKTISYYLMAVVSVAVAMIAAELTSRLLHTEPIASLMLCAIIFAAWFGGFGPAAVTISLIYIVGFLAAPFLPETRGKPLPA